MKRVLGIGNALTDILINLDTDDILERYSLAKGSMNLVDSPLQKRISAEIADLPRTLSLGGSAGNTIRAMAKLGSRTGFVGKVGHDTTGDFFEKALHNLEVEPTIFRCEEHSGRCVSLVSPDGERTMITHLGAAFHLSAPELHCGMFSGYDYLYVEGYLVQNHELIRSAMELAKSGGLKVVTDLASFNIVRENLGFLRELAEQHIDVLFANEQEAHAFTGEEDPLRALDAISEFCELGVVKVGLKGAYVRYGGETIHIGILKAANRVDTTGAGDFYAAGFLHGLCEGLSLRQCGTIGAITAGKVIEVVGTTFSEEVWDEIRVMVSSVKTEKYLF